MGPCRVLLALLAIGPGLHATAAPLPKGKAEDKPGRRGEVVEGWSLSLSLGSDKMSDDFRSPTSVTIALRNHAKRARTIQEVRAPEGNLRQAQGVSYVVRFKDGVVVEVPNPSRGIRGHFGIPPPHLPVRVPAGGKVEANHPSLHGLLFSLNRDAINAYRKCKVFAVTAIATEDGLNLRSDTVFVNGKFDLPKDHDPIADAKAYREAKAKRGKAKKPSR
jgi:hypothetical protein